MNVRCCFFFCFIFGWFSHELPNSDKQRLRSKSSCSTSGVQQTFSVVDVAVTIVFMIDTFVKCYSPKRHLIKVNSRPVNLLKQINSGQTKYIYEICVVLFFFSSLRLFIAHLDQFQQLKAEIFCS